MDAISSAPLPDEVHGHALPKEPEWVCWQVRPLQEFQLYNSMCAIDIEAYLPLIINVEQIKSKVYRERKRALFPGYMFSEQIPPMKLAELYRRRGIRFAFHPVGNLPVAAIDDLRLRQIEGFFPVSLSTALDDLAEGQQVTITKPGLWCGQTGLYSRRTADRVAVLMKMFARECLVEFSTSDVVIA